MIDLNIRLKSLIVHTDAYPCHSWEFDRKPLNPSESLRVPQLNPFLRSGLANSIFKNIQRLLLYCLQIGVRNREFDLNSLNSFTELTQLEIFEFDDEYPRKSYKLNLQKLKCLKILMKLQEDRSHIELDTPTLSIIIGDFDRLKVKHPRAVKVLNLESYGGRIVWRLDEFVNLEYLFIRGLYRVEDDFLAKLPNLKAIQFPCDSAYPKIFEELHKQRQALNRTQLQIHFQGIDFDQFPIDDLDPEHNSCFSSTRSKKRKYSSYPQEKFINELDGLNERNYKLYFTRSSRLAVMMPFVSWLQFRVVDLNPDKLLFFDRFINLKQVVVNHELLNPQLFFRFIERRKRLRALRFDGSNFRQAQFDVLDQFVPTLIELRILNEPNALCFAFVVKFQNLVIFKTDQFVSLDVIQQLCRKCKTDSQFWFSHHANRIEIDCDGGTLCGLVVHTPMNESREIIHDVCGVDELLVDLERFIEYN